jgi:deoxyribodipyrimidine photo-lyase
MTIHWFRRDLRLHDNNGLYRALRYAEQTNDNVLAVFIFDTCILEQLTNKNDARVQFIFEQLQELRQQLRAQDSDMLILQGDPVAIWQELSQKYAISAVFFNRDYEPYAQARDKAVHELLKAKNIATHSYKDQVIFEKLEVAKADNTPYTVFTPYSKRWKMRLEESKQADGRDALSLYDNKAYFSHFLAQNSAIFSDFVAPTLAKIGFEPSDIKIPAKNIENELIIHYQNRREMPEFENGTSRLGLHLRFGTISIRQLAERARNLSETFLNELIWRDFYAMILANFPHVVGHSFRKEYDNIAWRNNTAEFEAWKAGKTGYPLVDAGMRQLNATGFMHNRVRMVVASFLCKHLLIDWRWGEAYFAEKLLDFDLASNNGGWQWASGSGTDAAPYFRIFNPTAQQEKFDKNMRYIRRWVVDIDKLSYPAPIVVHAFARSRCLEVYKAALKP